MFAGAFAAVKLFDFAKSAVTEAAQTQKATENIKVQFKGASDQVLQFGDDAAKSFGISKQASEQFSSAIGLVGKNLGLGSAETAHIDLGLQKLAGSVGLIKGLDPASVFDKLQQALLGNTRGLKTLGISVDTTREKQALLDAGVIKATVDEAAVTKARLESAAAAKAAADAIDKYGKGSTQAATAVNDAQLKQQALQKALAGTVPTLTAANKAQAIYLLATKQLPGFLDQAKAHSGDLADEQRRLTAEWQNAKEEIGAALLPEVTKLEGGLLDVLKAAEENKGTIASVFHDAGTALTPVTAGVGLLADHIRTVGPLVLGTAAAFTVLKVAEITAGAAQAIYSTGTAVLNTAQVLLTQGTSGLAAAQAIQAGSSTAAAAAATAEAATFDALTLATAGVATAMTGAFTAETSLAIATAGLAAADDALAASATAAAAETGVLDAALLANPFGLAALGIAGVVGGLVALKSGLFGTSGEGDVLKNTFDRLTGSMHDVTSAAHGTRDAIIGIRSAEVTSQADQQALIQANHALATATREKGSAQTIYDAQLKVVNELEKNGLKGTSDYTAATKQLATDKGKLGAATKDYSDKLTAADQAQVAAIQSQAAFRAELAKARAEIAKNDSAIAALNTAFDNTTATSKAAADSILRVRGAPPRLVVDAGVVQDYANKMGNAASNASTFAKNLDETAAKDQKLANSFRDSNPVAAAAYQNLVNSASASAESAKKTALLDLAAQHLTGTLHDVPTTHQVDVYYARHLSELEREANALRDAILNIPISRTIRINFQQGHTALSANATGGFVNTGALSLAGEQGTEIIRPTPSGTEVTSHTSTVGLFQGLSNSLNAVANALAEQAQRKTAGNVQQFAPGSVVVNTPDAKALLTQLGELVPQ